MQKEGGSRVTQTTNGVEGRSGLSTLLRPGQVEHTPYPNEMRDHLANVRTFLAWIRTAIAIMAFGFVVAKFGLLLRELPGAHLRTTELHVSSFIGMALVLLGALFIALSLGDFLVVRRQIERQTIAFSPALHILLAVILLAVSIGLAVYIALTA